MNLRMCVSVCSESADFGQVNPETDSVYIWDGSDLPPETKSCKVGITLMRSDADEEGWQ